MSVGLVGSSGKFGLAMTDVDDSTMPSASTPDFSSVKALGVDGRSRLSLDGGVSTQGEEGVSTGNPVLFEPLDTTARVLGLGLGERDFFLFLDGSYAAVRIFSFCKEPFKGGMNQTPRAIKFHMRGITL